MKEKKYYGPDKILYKLPHNLSFVNEKIAGSGLVGDKHSQALVLMGFTDIICLTEECIKLSDSRIKVHHFPIRDRYAPDLATTFKILNRIEVSIGKTLVHCLGGIGRTNTILCCYMMKHNNEYAPSEVISILERHRKVKLTTDQINHIKEFYGTKDGIKRKNSKLPKWIMLVGLPCSGKTTLSMKFIREYGDVIHVNQDDLGKKDCYKLISDNFKNTKTLILDMCNHTKAHRKELLSLLNGQPYDIILLDFGLNTVLERLDNRAIHPTLASRNSMGKQIITRMHAELEPPTKDEAATNLFIVKNNQDLRQVYKFYGLSFFDPDELVKFPRTSHLFNIGAASRDDLICDPKSTAVVLSHDLYIEEKVDGANMGIFIDSSGTIRVQNRSHFVTSDYHPQFKRLYLWINNHEKDLRLILGDGKHILYGEWMAAKHSIHYTNLPDIFLAFDLYNREEKVFLSRSEMKSVLKNTNIVMVPRLAEGKFTREELMALLKTKSQFTDGLIEGVYIRIDSPKVLLDRYKIVRTDFICGNEHWDKRSITENIIIMREC